LIERSITEGTDLIIEGVHLLPGFSGRRACFARQLIPGRDGDDEELHRSRRTRQRPARAGMALPVAFAKIRDIQYYINEQAAAHNTQILDVFDFDSR
jgi:2-phosphoglycerate kinase